MQRRPFIFIMFTAAFFLSSFYQMANAVIASDLSAELGLTAAELGGMSSVFFATFALVQIPLGIGLDRWGPRWVTSGLMLIGVVGSLMFAAAPSLAWLTIGRGLIGVGMASILMGSLKAFSQWYPPQQFATMSGLLVSIGSLGAFFAATPLAWLNEQVGWRAVFVVMGVVTLVAALTISIFGRNTPPDVHWPKPAERQAGFIQVLSDTRLWRMIPIALFLAGAGFAFQGLWAGPYLTDVYDLNQIDVGNRLLLVAIGATIGSAAAGWLADRFDLVRIVLLITALFIATQVSLAFRPPLGVVNVTFVLFGFSNAFNILILAHGRRLFPDEITGQALTVINLFMFAGIFLLQWLMGVVIGTFDLSASAEYPPQAYTAALLVTAACSVVAFVVYLPFLRQPKV